MKIAVASGKGGTGKTTVAVNLALSLGNVQLIDCDVEEPNAHLFLKPELTEKKQVTVKVPQVDKDLCTYCGICGVFCRYNALAVAKDTMMVFPQLCHSCGGCVIACPQKAIREVERPIGVLEKGAAGNISFVHGILSVGEAMSTPLIKAVKREADAGDAILDVPPGTACPVIESLKGVDYCVLVAEPTPFGLHDLKIAVETLEAMSIPYGVVVNKDGVGDGRVHEFCGSMGIPVLMRVPDDRRIAELYSNGVPFITELSEYRVMFREMFKQIGELVA